MKKSLGIISIISCIGMFLFSIACAFDWINKIDLHKDWFFNVLYHPFTGFIFTLSFLLVLISVIELFKPKIIRNSLYEIKNYSIYNILWVLVAVGFINSIITVYFMFTNGESGIVDDLLITFVHFTASTLFFVMIIFLVTYMLIKKDKVRINNLDRIQNILSIFLILSILIIILFTLLGRNIG